MANDCPVAEAKFLKKYQGLHFIDIDDNDQLHVIITVKYAKRRGWWAYSAQVNDDGIEDKVMEDYGQEGKKETRFPSCGVDPRYTATSAP